MHVVQRTKNAKALRLLEVWKFFVLGEPQISQEAEFQLAARLAVHAVKGQELRHNKSVMSVTTSADTPPFAVARPLLTLTSCRDLKRNRYIGLVDVGHRHTQRHSQTDTTVNRCIGYFDVAATIGLGQGILLRELYEAGTASRIWILSARGGTAGWLCS